MINFDKNSTEMSMFANPMRNQKHIEMVAVDEYFQHSLKEKYARDTTPNISFDVCTVLPSQEKISPLS